MAAESLAPVDSLEVIFSKEAADNYINNLLYDENNSPLLLSQTYKKFKKELGPPLAKFRSLNVYLAASIPQIIYQEAKKDQERANYFKYGFATVLAFFFSNYDGVDSRRIKRSGPKSGKDELLDTLRSLLAKDGSLEDLDTKSPAVERVAEFVGKNVLARRDLYPIFKTGVFTGYRALQTLI